MRRLIIFLILLLAPKLVFSEEARGVEFFGLELDKPFSVPKCKKNDAQFPEFTKKTCWLEPGQKFDEAGTIVAIWLPSSVILPFGFISSGMLYGSIIDGRLAALNIHTFGIKVQDKALDALKEKLGESSSLKEISKKDDYENTFTVHDARWDIGDITVFFKTDKIDWGSISATTKRFNEETARLQALEAAKPKPKL